MGKEIGSEGLARKRENLSDGRAYGDARSVVGIVLARRSQRYVEEVFFGVR
jgi:hypothetical protein